jgi:predicted RNA binding protein YcfA (HicA-like mRNA interferase family)
MSKRDKLRRKLRNNPKGAKFSDLETLLLQFGFTLVRVKGSHHFFQYQKGDAKAILVVPLHGNAVKAQYVKDSIEVLDELFPEAADQDEDE